VKLESVAGHISHRKIMKFIIITTMYSGHIPISRPTCTPVGR